ncbi:MAG: Ig-like domain-containing protein [Pseudomonadota bacterium]
MTLVRLMLCLGAITLMASGGIWIGYVHSGVWQAQLRAEIENSFNTSKTPTDWVRFHVRGRDVVLFGEAPDGEALRSAQALIKSADGVGKLTSLARLRDWGELTPPTVAPLATRSRRPVVSGTWSPEAAETMSVELDGVLFLLGEDESLEVRGNVWRLTPGHDLADGVYDVEVTAWRAQVSASDASSGELTIDTKPPPPPEVAAYFGRSLTPQISGRWPVAKAASLRVEVAGHRYTLGKDPELTSSPSGRWTLNVSAPVKEGVNEVVATAFDQVGNAQADLTSGELMVDRKPPALPTVNRFQSSRAFTLTGSWPEGDAVALELTVDGQTHKLGEGSGLVSAGEGRWRFNPSVLPGEGVYDVVVRTRDRAGNVSKDATTDELVIKFVPERDHAHGLEEAPRPLTSIMCQQAFRQVLARTPVGFAAGATKPEPQSTHVLDKLAGIAARCPAARIEIAAHTHALGDFVENRILTHQRAYWIANHFVRRGISRSRLSSVGYGEVRPIASNNTAAGRAKNERVELYVKR